MRTADNPWLSWSYVQANQGGILAALGQHVGLTLQAVAIALAIAFPLAVLAHSRPRLAGPILGLSGALYTIPSLALFAIRYPILRDRRATILVGLVLYAMLVLVRNILVGLQDVDPAVTDAARGIGYGGLGQLMFRSFRSLNHAEIVTATLLTVAIALVADIALWSAGRLATPWVRAGGRG